MSEMTVIELEENSVVEVASPGPAGAQGEPGVSVVGAVMFRGAWNASTNTPALADGKGEKGDMYRVTAAASRNLGSGAIDFQVGDDVIYDGAVWFKVDTTDAVASVNGKTGAVAGLEESANKVQALSGQSESEFPSEKAVQEGIAGAAALPSHARPRSNYAGHPSRHLYLPDSFKRRKSQAALGKAMTGRTGSAETGGAATIICIGDSETVGRPNVLTGFPFQLRTFLKTLGYPIGGTGAWGALPGPEQADSRWTLGGSWTWNGSFWLRATSENSEVKFVSDIAGTAVDVWFFGNSAKFTVAIDGGAAVEVSPSGVNGKVEKYSVTGLANATHTVAVKSKTATATYISAINVYSPNTGIQIANFGSSGSRVSEWMKPTAEVFQRPNQVQAIYPSPDIVTISLGVNDLTEGVALATYKKELEELVARYQGVGADVYLIAQVQKGAFAEATWKEWVAAQYDVADAKGCGLLDAYDLAGPYATANTNGLMLADGTHPNAAVYWHMAKGLAALIGAL